jgi:uncharacterized cupin superfamily protein
MTEDLAVNEDELDWTHVERGDHEFRRKQLGEATAGKDIGCSLYELPEGKRGWKRHYHTGNEEAIFVLDGQGTLYLGPDAEPRELTTGDFVALPADERGAHDVEGGEGGLRYLMVSTMNDPDITVYPDDDSVGLYAGSPPGGDKDERSLSKFLDVNAEVEYWDDE